MTVSFECCAKRVINGKDSKDTKAKLNINQNICKKNRIYTVSIFLKDEKSKTK